MTYPASSVGEHSAHDTDRKPVGGGEEIPFFSKSEATDTRLIERWLPIAALGEESVRERRSMTALPPTYYLHVWWARRPLVASRAAVLASVLPADRIAASLCMRLVFMAIQLQRNNELRLLTVRVNVSARTHMVTFAPLDGRQMPLTASGLLGLGCRERSPFSTRPPVAVAFPSKRHGSE